MRPDAGSDPASRLPHAPVFHKLDGPVTEPFDCGSPDQNDFLIKNAWVHQQEGFSTTYVVHLGGMLAGYVTVVMSEIDLAPDERPPTAPFAKLGALKLAQMAVDRRFQDHGLGTMLVDFVIARARSLSYGDAACRYVILDSVPGRESFYEGLGFVVNDRVQKARAKRAKNADQVTLSMRFDIREPGELGRGAIDTAPPTDIFTRTVGAIAGLAGWAAAWLRDWRGSRHRND